MPDDTPAAVAEQDPPAGPSVPEAPAPPGAEAAPKPSDEREPPEGVSGTPEGEETAEEQPALSLDEQELELIAQITKGNPEKAAKFLGVLQGDLPPELQDRLQGLDERQVGLDRQQAVQETQAGLGQVLSAYKIAVEDIGGAAQTFAKQQAENVKSAALDLRDRGSAESSVELLDSETTTTRVTEVAGRAMQAEKILAWGLAHNTALRAMVDHPLAKYITSEDRKQLKATEGQNYDDQLRAVVSVCFEAGARSVPAEQPKATKAEKAADDERLARLERLRDGVGRNNGKVPKGAAASVTQPRNETEARNLHATGKWSNQQMREYLATH